MLTFQRFHSLHCIYSHCCLIMSCILKELGVGFEVKESLQAKLGNHWHTAKKLSTARAFSVLALSQLLKEYAGTDMTALRCLDAIPGLGIAGVLWKLQFQDKVEIVVNTIDNDDENRALPVVHSNSKFNCSYACTDPNSLLHSGRIFNFIYLESSGNCMRYLESACHAVSHRGILCIISTDISVLYNKSPDRVRRIYHGHTMKNEYMKETAVRLVLANLARAASRWDRGFSVILSYVDADSVVVIVRMLKGATHADRSLCHIKKIAHCRQCQFHRLQDETFHFIMKSDEGECFCKENGLGSDELLPPIVLLGPIYAGPIFDPNFMHGMMKDVRIIEPKHKTLHILQNMILEGFCCTSNESETELINSFDISKKVLNRHQDNEPPDKKAKVQESFEELASKYNFAQFPALFAIPQTHVKQGCNAPKTLNVINKLRSEGYQACRTLFDPRGVRTSASMRDFRRVVFEISGATSEID